MKSTLVALASALLLAVAITELSTRIWPDSHLALLLLSFVALLLNGFFNARQAAGTAVAATTSQGAPEAKQKRSNNRNQSNRDSRGGGRNRDESRSNEAGSGRKPAKAAAPVADGPREEGVVKWFNRSKGFGFVVRENGEEIFVHQRSIRSDQGKSRPVLKDGERVSYVVAERERGLQAEDVVSVSAG